MDKKKVLIMENIDAVYVVFWMKSNIINSYVG